MARLAILVQGTQCSPFKAQYHMPLFLSGKKRCFKVSVPGSLAQNFTINKRGAETVHRAAKRLLAS